MCLAKIRRSEPSGRKETIAAAHFEWRTQWSQVVETLIRSRPPDVATMALFDAPATGPRRIVRRVVKRVPCSPPNAVTRPIEAT